MSRHETHQMALDLAEFLSGAVRRDEQWMDLVAKNRALRTENEEARRLLGMPLLPLHERELHWSEWERVVHTFLAGSDADS